jgi:hypothetical protein
MELLTDYRIRDGKWKGKIYDPNSGSTYSSTMQVDREGNLKMRGYIGFAMFGKTAIFEPASSCKPHIIEMFAIAGRALAGCRCGDDAQRPN